MSVSFETGTMEILKNINFELEVMSQKSNSMSRVSSDSSLHIMAAEKKTTRAKIQVKNKRTHFYYPLGVHIINFTEKSD